MSQFGSHRDHLVLHRLLGSAAWPYSNGQYRIADGDDAYAVVMVNGKEARLELVPGSTEQFVITKYGGEPLPAGHPLTAANPTYEMAMAGLGHDETTD